MAQKTLKQRAIEHYAKCGVSLPETVSWRWCPIIERRSVPESRTKGTPAESIAVANTASVDMEGDVVLPEGGNPAIFQRLKSIYWNHEYYTKPIGTLRSVSLDPGGAGWKAAWSWASTEDAQEVRVLVEEEAVNGTSIGFIPKDVSEPTEEEERIYGAVERMIRTWDWFELSVTPMPCNPDALIERSISGEISEEFALALDRLVCKGAIRRESAVRFGLKDARRVVVNVPERITLDSPRIVVG